MRVFLSKYNVGKVSGYVLQTSRVHIDVINKIGEYWLMTLSHVDPRARSDINELIGFPDVAVDDDQGEV